MQNILNFVEQFGHIEIWLTQLARTAQITSTLGGQSSSRGIDRLLKMREQQGGLDQDSKWLYRGGTQVWFW